MNRKRVNRPGFVPGPRGFALALGVILVAAATAGCGSGSTTLVGPTASKCQISVTEFTQTFGPTGGSGSVAVEAARECTWSASTPTTWISLPAPAQGQGTGTLTFSVQPNQVPRSRSGSLEVNGQRLSVSQEPAPCRFDISAGGQQWPAAGGTGSVDVTAMDGCAWTASSPVPWVSIVSGATGGSGGTVRYTVAANPGLQRSAVLTIAGHSYTVEQAEAPAPAPPTPPPPTPPPTPPPPTPPLTCELVVAPLSLSFAASGGQASVRVTVQTGCVWEVTGGADWLSVTPERGSGSATIGVSAAPNLSSAPRSSALSVGGQTVTVSQAAAASAVVELSGKVRSPDGDCPNRRFQVDGTLVIASAETQYIDSDCSDLKNNRDVWVEGLRAPDGSVTALRIQVRKD